jgi:hypothetical protein
MCCLEKILHPVARHNFQKAAERLMLRLKTAKKMEVVCAKLQVGFLHQIINQLGRRLAPASPDAQRDCGNHSRLLPAASSSVCLHGPIPPRTSSVIQTGLGSLYA